MVYTSEIVWLLEAILKLVPSSNNQKVVILEIESAIAQRLPDSNMLDWETFTISLFCIPVPSTIKSFCEAFQA